MKIGAVLIQYPMKNHNKYDETVLFVVKEMLRDLLSLVNKLFKYENYSSMAQRIRRKPP